MKSTYTNLYEQMEESLDLLLSEIYDSDVLYEYTKKNYGVAYYDIYGVSLTSNSVHYNFINKDGAHFGGVAPLKEILYSLDSLGELND
jgi:hypothetical protein